MFIDILNISIFATYWNVGYEYDTIEAMPGSDFVLVNSNFCTFIFNTIYTLKAIAN